MPVKPETVIQLVTFFLETVERARRGNPRALRKLEDFLPKHTYTRVAREVEAAKDERKYGRQ